MENTTSNTLENIKKCSCSSRFPRSSKVHGSYKHRQKKITKKFPSIEANIVKSQSKAIKIKKTKREMEEQIKSGAESFETNNDGAA
jgi:hypothetical protein